VQRGEADDPVGGAVADELEAVMALAADAAALKRREHGLDAPSPDLKCGPLDRERAVSGAGVEGVQARVVPRPRRLRLAARYVDRAAPTDARFVRPIRSVWDLLLEEVKLIRRRRLEPGDYVGEVAVPFRGVPLEHREENGLTRFLRREGFRPFETNQELWFRRKDGSSPAA